MNRLLQFRKKILKKEETPEVPSEEAEYNPNEYGTVVDSGGHGEHAKKPKKSSLEEAIKLKINIKDSEGNKVKKFSTYATENDNNHLGNSTESVQSELHSRHKYSTVPKTDSVYKYTQGSYDLNSYLLRKHKNPKETSTEFSQLEHAKDLDKATRHKALGHELHVYHGTKFHPGVEAAKHPQNRLMFPSFISTSIDKHKAHNFSKHFTEHDEPAHHIIHFHLKDENKGLYIGESSRHPHEKEFLMPRHSSVKINPKPTKFIDDSGRQVHIWHATDIQHHPIRDKISKEDKELLDKIRTDKVYKDIVNKDYDRMDDHITSGKFKPEHKEFIKNSNDLSKYSKNSIFNRLANHNQDLTKEELSDYVDVIPSNYKHLTKEKIDHIVNQGKAGILGEHAADLGQDHIKTILNSETGSIPSGLLNNRRLTNDQTLNLVTKEPSLSYHLKGSKLNHVVKHGQKEDLNYFLRKSPNLSTDHITHLMNKSKDNFALENLIDNEHNADKFTKKHIDELLNRKATGIYGNIHRFKNATSEQLNRVLKESGYSSVTNHPNFKVDSENSKDILAGSSYFPDKIRDEAAKNLAEKHLDYVIANSGREDKVSLLRHNDKLKPRHLLKILQNAPYSEIVSELVAKHKNYDGNTALNHIQFGKDKHESHHIEAALKSGKLSRKQLRDLKLSDHSEKMEDLRKEVLSKLAMKEINQKIEDERSQKVNPEPEEKPKETDDEHLHKLLDNHLKVQKNHSGVNMPSMSPEDYTHLQNNLLTMKHGHIKKLLNLKNYTQSKLKVLAKNPNVSKGHLQAAFKGEDDTVSKYALSRLVKF